MNATDSPPILNDYAIDQIAFRARAIGRKLGLSNEDIEDLQQELTLAVLDLVDRFEPDTASLPTFINSALDWVIRSRGRNDEPAMLDIDELDEVDEPVTNDPRCGEASLFDVIDQRIDVALAVQSMPADLQKICKLLTVYSIDEVCDRLKIGRVKFHSQLARIRAILSEFLNES